MILVIIYKKNPVITTLRVLCIIAKHIFPALMQPSYALLPATSYPEAVRGMCYAIIKAHINNSLPFIILQGDLGFSGFFLQQTYIHEHDKCPSFDS